MKKLLYFFFAITLLGCSSNEDDNLRSIEGRWDFISMTESGKHQEQSSCNLKSYIILDNGLCDIFWYEDEGSNAPCTLLISYFLSYSAVDNSSNTYYVTPNNQSNANDGEFSIKVNGNSLIITEKFDSFVDTMTFIRD